MPTVTVANEELCLYRKEMDQLHID